MTDNEIASLTQAVERLLLNHDIHLNTDRFNALDDYLTELIREIEENGE